ncbi:MAG TPA: GDSL-type esterase/lipase family protein, partial [Mycobacterium sp.]|nr:GDSL-type esterase/lipase family protein [Mycobacterium sp.]
MNVTVIGDSNSAPLQSRISWVERIQNENLLPQVHAVANGTQELADVEWFNSAIVGWACVGTWWGINSGLAWVGSASTQSDVIVVSAGTNDLQAFGATPQEVLDCYGNMQDAATMANVAMFVATTPPVYPPYMNAEGDAAYWNQQISALNTLVRASFDPAQVIDFDTGMSPEMYLGDGRHLNDTGQQLRAQRVATAIKAAQCIHLADHCSSSPLLCDPAPRSVLSIKDGGGNNHRRLRWKWDQGGPAGQTDFGDPTISADYGLCVYAGTASTLVAESIVPAGAPQWRALATKGYKYKDPAG